MTTYSLLQHGNLFSDEFKRKTIEIHDYYVQIEFDPHIEHDEKFKHMEDWWRESNQLLINEGANMNIINEAVQSSNILFRDGCTYFFELCHKYNIPILVFSAGITQVIESIFNHKLKMYDNIHIVSNELIFDDNEKIIGIKDPIIHSLNKGEHSYQLLKEKGKSYFNDVSTRKNIILMGDTLGDSRMTDGFHHSDVILKVGFLNTNIQNMYPKFKDVFDLVITNDGSMYPLVDVLEKVIGNNK